MEIRSLTELEIGSLEKLWNDAIGPLFPIDERLLRQNLYGDPNFLPEDLVGAFNENNELIATVAFKQNIVDLGLQPADLTVGSISFLLISPMHRKRGIGKKLLELAENRLKERGVTNIKLGQDTRHFFPGVPCLLKEANAFFTKAGYQTQGLATDLSADLSRVDLAGIVGAKGLQLNESERYTFGSLQFEDIDELNAFFERSFPGRWYFEVTQFLQKSSMLEDIVVVKDVEKGKIVGFARICNKDSDVLGANVVFRGLLGENYGGLGPIGIDPDYRKEKLGLTLLYHGLKSLQERQVKQAVIDWTGLLDFYGIFNFIPWKEYNSMNKPIIGGLE